MAQVRLSIKVLALGKMPPLALIYIPPKRALRFALAQALLEHPGCKQVAILWTEIAWLEGSSAHCTGADDDLTAKSRQWQLTLHPYWNYQGGTLPQFPSHILGASFDQLAQAEKSPQQGTFPWPAPAMGLLRHDSVNRCH